MVTGDNLLTALNVARKCNIVPKKNRVILVDAHPPTVVNETDFEPAKIDWQLAEPFNDLDEQTINDQVTIACFNLKAF